MEALIARAIFYHKAIKAGYKRPQIATVMKIREGSLPDYIKQAYRWKKYPMRYKIENILMGNALELMINKESNHSIKK